MSIKDMIEKLKEIVPLENFRKQPEHAQREIVKLEKKYNLNTNDFLDSKYSIKIEKGDYDSWFNQIETFVIFDGRLELINTIDCSTWNNEQK